jgi:hypothetical protein
MRQKRGRGAGIRKRRSSPNIGRRTGLLDLSGGNSRHGRAPSRAGVPRGAASGLNDSLWNAGDHEHDTGGAAKTRRGALDAVILEDNRRGHGDPLGQLSPSTRSGPLVAVVTLALCRRWVRITGQTTSAAFALPIHSPGMMRTIDSRASRLRQKLARHSAGQHDPRARHSQSDSWAG